MSALRPTFHFFTAQEQPLLLLVCAPLAADSCFDQFTTLAVKQQLERASQHQPFIFVESAKVARRLWLNSGLERSYVDQFVEIGEGEAELSLQWFKEQQQRGDGTPTLLIVDEGVPCWHDPGVAFVRACHQLNRRVAVTPFPQSSTLAMILSGFPLERVMHWGFPPPGMSREDRLSFWSKFIATKETAVVMDTAYRLEQCLSELRSLPGTNRRYALGRNLQRSDEEFSLGTLTQLWDHLQQQKSCGEWVKKDFILVQSP